MSRESSGIQGFLSVLISILLLTVTLVFSGDLTNRVSGFTVDVFKLKTTAEGIRVSGENSSLGSENEVYKMFLGFGSGIKEEKGSAGGAAGRRDCDRRGYRNTGSESLGRKIQRRTRCPFAAGSGL